MKKAIKILILFLLVAFYKIVGLICPGKELIVLMYHSISLAGGPLAISPKMFEKQLAYLKTNNYKFITVKELLNSKNGLKTKQNMVLLTFDDGYRDLITDALPILKKFNAPSLAFIHTSRSSENLGNNFSMLNWDEIRELEKNGVTIGNHSHSHQDLKTLSPEGLDLEIKTSEEVFTKELGVTPKVFAYPGGKYNTQVMEFLRRYGYEAAFTIDEGVISKNDGLLQLKRIGIGGNTAMLEFRLMLSRAFNGYQFLRKSFGFKK